MKIKTKLTAPVSPPAESPSSVSSFEVVSRERPQSKRMNTSNSDESFGCPDARAVVEELEKVKMEREHKRRSKFREEL